MTKRTAEDLVAEWEKTGVATVNLDELKALVAENRRLREALKKMQARYEGGQKAESIDRLQQALYDSMKPQ